MPNKWKIAEQNDSYTRVTAELGDGVSKDVRLNSIAIQTIDPRLFGLQQMPPNSLAFDVETHDPNYKADVLYIVPEKRILIRRVNKELCEYTGSLENGVLDACRDGVFDS